MVDRDMPLEQFFATRHPELGLYVVFLRSIRPFDRADPEAAELLRQHFVYWWELEEQGKLIGAGPFSLGTEDECGMAVLLAASPGEARALAEAEPMHRAGWRRNEVHTWQLNEGLAVKLVQDLLAQDRA
jgi:uncharacterized protein YciI